MHLLHLELPTNDAAQMQFKMKGDHITIASMIVHAMEISPEIGTMFVTAVFQWLEEHGQSANTVRDMYEISRKRK